MHALPSPMVAHSQGAGHPVPRPRPWFSRCARDRVHRPGRLPRAQFRRQVPVISAAAENTEDAAPAPAPAPASVAPVAEAPPPPPRPRAAPPPPELLPERFEPLFQQLLAWHERFYDCIVPRQAFDAGELGEWVHRLRRLRTQGRLPPELVGRLEELGFAWKVDPVTAKWYHNLHVARRYKELHGTAEIPPDYADPEEPDFVEAGRWLERQRDLYARQKLLRVRVRLMKEALGVKFARAYAPPRKNLHPVIRREDAKFQAELDRRAQRAQQEGQHAQKEEGRPAGEVPQQWRGAQPRRRQGEREPPARPESVAEAGAGMS